MSDTFIFLEVGFPSGIQRKQVEKKKKKGLYMNYPETFLDANPLPHNLGGQINF